MAPSARGLGNATPSRDLVAAVHLVVFRPGIVEGEYQRFAKPPLHAERYQKWAIGSEVTVVVMIGLGIRVEHVSSHEVTAECKAAGVKLFPSWQFGNSPPKEGVLSLAALSDKTGCILP